MQRDTATSESSIHIYREIERGLTSPAAPFELVEVDGSGGLVRTYRNGAGSLWEIFAEMGRRHGDNLLTVDSGDAITYSDMIDRAQRFGAALVELYGVRRGDNVGIMMANQPAYLTALFGIASTGATAVLYNSRAALAEVGHAIEDVPSAVIIADEKRADLLRAVSPHIAIIGVESRPDDSTRSIAQAINSVGAGLTSSPVAPGDTALILFTSGTTGRAKGVCLSHRNMANVMMNMRFVIETNLGIAARSYGLDVEAIRPLIPRVSALLIFPLFHVSGMAALMSAMNSGGLVMMMSRWDPRIAADLIHGHQLSLMAGPPMTVEELLALPDAGHTLTSLTNVVPGGQATPPNLVKHIADRLPNAQRSDGWGMTEMGGSVCTAGGAVLAENPGTVGPMSPTMDVRAVDTDGRVLAPGETGELELRGGMLMTGYVGTDAAADLNDGWLRSGDIGFIDENGLVFLVDRKKDLVISAGENISCTEIEGVLAATDRFTEVAAFGVPDDRLGERLVVAVIPREQFVGISRDAIVDLLAKVLPAYKIPSEIVFDLGPLPRTATGKLMKRKLRESYLVRGGPGIASKRVTREDPAVPTVE